MSSSQPIDQLRRASRHVIRSKQYVAQEDNCSHIHIYVWTTTAMCSSLVAGVMLVFVTVHTLLVFSKLVWVVKQLPTVTHCTAIGNPIVITTLLLVTTQSSSVGVPFRSAVGVTPERQFWHMAEMNYYFLFKAKHRSLVPCACTCTPTRLNWSF